MVVNARITKVNKGIAVAAALVVSLAVLLSRIALV